MIVDKVKTRKYYESISSDMLCECACCRLYYSESRMAFPELAEWLSQYGIDIEKPFEAMSIDPDENGVVEYIGVQYIVFGSCPENYFCKVGEITICLASSYPDTGITDKHFVLEVYSMKLSMKQ